MVYLLVAEAYGLTFAPLGVGASTFSCATKQKTDRKVDSLFGTRERT